MLAKADDFFTEFIYNFGQARMFILTINLPLANLSGMAKPQLSLELKLHERQKIFYMSAHPPHHVMYDRELLRGLQRFYVDVAKVKAGETMEVSYSYSQTKIIELNTETSKCQVDNWELDTCQRNLVEDSLSCKLPWRRASQIKSSFNKACNMEQIDNASNALKGLGEGACSMACERYVPKLTRKSFKYYSGWIMTRERYLSFSISTDQIVLPVEQTVLSYDSVNAIADVGGYLGLLLGASCMSMIRFVYKRFHWAFKRFKPTLSGSKRVKK